MGTAGKSGRVGGPIEDAWEPDVDRARRRITVLVVALVVLLALQIVLLAVRGGTSHVYGAVNVGLVALMLAAALLARAASSGPRGAVLMFCVAGGAGVGCMGACTVLCGETPWVLAPLSAGIPLLGDVVDLRRLDRGARRFALALILALLLCVP